MHRIVAVLIGLMALPLFAQNSVIDQGRAAMARNDADAAVTLFEKAVAQNPKSAEAHYRLGTAYELQGQSAGMMGQAASASKTHDELEKAIALDPNHLPARYALLQYYTMVAGFTGGSYDDALAQAAEIKKRDAQMGHRAAAFIYSNQKKTDEAMKESLDEVKEFPKSPRAHLDLAIRYSSAKNYKAAVDELETALKLDAAFMPAAFRIGQYTVLGNGNLARGEAVLRKYLAYTPKDDDPPLARAHYWLGQIFEKQGKKAEAKASFTASLKLNPNQKDVAEALKRVS